MSTHTGAVAWVFGDDFDADEIVGPENMTVQDMTRLREVCMAPFTDGFAASVTPGDVLVAGRNFGYGHVHDQPMMVMRDLGIRIVLAESYAPFFARSERYSGMQLLVCPGIGDRARRGDAIEIDLAALTVSRRDGAWSLPIVPPAERDRRLFEAGGGVNLLRDRHPRRTDAAPDGADGAEVADGKERLSVLEDVLSSRWSCRAFTDEDVPLGQLEQVFATAQATASWCNVQPWQVWLVRGAAREEFARRLVEHARDRLAPSDWEPDLPMPTEYRGVYADRRRAAGYALYASLGIERSDLAGREAAMLRNYEFFGAPVVAVVTTDPALGTYGAIDCGAYVGNVLNAATAVGLATIAQGALGTHAAAVREIVGIPDDRAVVCGIGIGYPDLEHRANRFRTERASFASAVTVVDELDSPR